MKKILLSIALLLTSSCFRHAIKDLKPEDAAAELNRIESHLFDAKMLIESPNGQLVFANLKDRMKDATVPGISYAIIRNSQIYPRFHGFAKSKPDQSIKEDSLFQAASISKTATGLLLARLHEIGLIDLDKSINDYLREYNIDFRLREGIKIQPESFTSTKHNISTARSIEIFETLKKHHGISEDNYINFGDTPSEWLHNDLKAIHDVAVKRAYELRAESPTRPEVNRSIRQILSHSAGISVPGLPGYFVKDAPSKMELLLGVPKTKMSAIEVVHLPYCGDLSSLKAKTKASYSGGGYVLVELLLEKIFAQSFAAIARTYLFDPLGMNKSTFEQSSTDSVTINGLNYTKAEGYDEQGQTTHYGTKIFPAQSMAGLWTTPSDIAKMALALNNSLQGSEKAYLSKKMAQECLKGAGQKSGDSQAGLGVFSNGQEFSHNGFNPGFSSLYKLDHHGDGIVFMINSSNGYIAGEELLNANNFVSGKLKKLPKYTIVSAHNDLAKLAGNYENKIFKLSINLIANQLFATLWQKGEEKAFMGSHFPIYPIKGGKFAANTVLPFPIFFKFSDDKVIVEHKEWPDMEGIYQKTTDSALANFIQWHNQFFSGPTRAISHAELSAFFADDIYFEVNAKKIAESIDEMVRDYGRIKNKGHKLVKIEALDEKVVKPLNNGITEIHIKHDITMIFKDDSKKVFKVEANVFIRSGKIFKYIEKFGG